MGSQAGKPNCKPQGSRSPVRLCAALCAGRSVDIELERLFGSTGGAQPLNALHRCLQSHNEIETDPHADLTDRSDSGRSAVIFDAEKDNWQGQSRPGSSRARSAAAEATGSCGQRRLQDWRRWGAFQQKGEQPLEQSRLRLARRTTFGSIQEQRKRLDVSLERELNIPSIASITSSSNSRFWFTAKSSRARAMWQTAAAAPAPFQSVDLYFPPRQLQAPSPRGADDPCHDQVCR